MPASHEQRIDFAGEVLLLDAAGALVLPAHGALVVSDLHLEKGSFLARHGAPLPRYDSRDTLQRLAQLIEHYRPREVVCLGDSFHDREAYARLQQEDKDSLHRLVASVECWHWVLGNHDPALPSSLPGQSIAHMRLGGFLLCHEPEKEPVPQLIGHFHPKTQVRLGGQRVSGRCFVVGKERLIMPAFGSYTGGLDTRHEAIGAVTGGDHACYLLYRKRIWKLAATMPL